MHKKKLYNEQEEFHRHKTKRHFIENIREEEYDAEIDDALHGSNSPKSLRSVFARATATGDMEGDSNPPM